LVQSSSRKVVIGNPQFDTKREEVLRRAPPESAKTILIVSQGTVTAILVKLALDLARLCVPHGYKILYRLHPGEVPFVERYSALQNVPGIEIDKDQDIYALIGRCGHIVGSYSLTLFEAAGLNKNIYVLDSEVSSSYIPPDIGQRFKSADELF